MGREVQIMTVDRKQHHGPALPALVQKFFSEHLISQKQVSPHTVRSYRDTFRLLLKYTGKTLGRKPVDMMVIDLDSDLIGDFLSHVENGRGNGASTRNLRLSAIRSFFHFVSIRNPEILLHCQQVLAIPAKRHDKRLIDFLEPDESAALLAAPDTTTWIGRRDRTLLLVALQTGLRVSELISLTIGDVRLVPKSEAHVRCMGKGRKERTTPLRSDCGATLSQWIRERAANSDDPLFTSNRRGRFSCDAVERIVRKYTRLAAKTCPSLHEKRVSPHTLRHTTAMELLRSGAGCTVIALWLGHESVETTQIYLHADLEIKRQAMDRTRPVDVSEGVYRPDDEVLTFLHSLSCH